MKHLPLLEQRKTEAKVLAPLIRAFEEEFGREKTRALVGKTIKELAKRYGEAIAAELEGTPIEKIAALLPRFNEGDALELDVLKQDASCYEFNVTRCRFAEFYKELGIPELGQLLSCNRDFALSEGISSELELERSQTIMEGASHCDFRFRLKNPPPKDQD
ncbi:MAG: L-2-amino-thiazoline-4-carboxylic acid hydrolase [Planctomycetota bacterium]|jgi:predicted ArsR family transcriptional regulator